MSKDLEEKLRNNPDYRRIMDYMNGKKIEADKKYGPILGRSPVSLAIESLEKLDKSLLKLRKFIDKDKKVVKLSDYRF